MAEDIRVVVVEHELKTWPAFFELIESGEKRVELRRDDRDFTAGDVLFLREWKPITREFTARSCRRRVTHVLRGEEWGIKRGFAALSIEKVERSPLAPVEAKVPVPAPVKAHLILRWIPEFGEPAEIDLGEPFVHNGQDGRFELTVRNVSSGDGGNDA